MQGVVVVCVWGGLEPGPHKLKPASCSNYVFLAKVSRSRRLRRLAGVLYRCLDGEQILLGSALLLWVLHFVPLLRPLSFVCRTLTCIIIVCSSATRSDLTFTRCLRRVSFTGTKVTSALFAYSILFFLNLKKLCPIKKVQNVTPTLNCVCVGFHWLFLFIIQPQTHKGLWET